MALQLFNGGGKQMPPQLQHACAFFCREARASTLSKPTPHLPHKNGSRTSIRWRRHRVAAVQCKRRPQYRGEEKYAGYDEEDDDAGQLSRKTLKKLSKQQAKRANTQSRKHDQADASPPPSKTSPVAGAPLAARATRKQRLSYEELDEVTQK
mgnify:CR=1 FL=1